MSNQIRLTPGDLLDAQGRLSQAGYATSLVKTYRRSDIKAHSTRIKEWDYYCVTCGDVVLALTIADNSYMGLDSVSLLDLSRSFQHTWSAMRFWPDGSTRLPATSQTGDLSVERPGYSLRFANDGQTRRLTVQVDRFKDGKPLAASIDLTHPPRDSMVIATPFAGKPKAFYYNQKINCLRADGYVTFDDRTYLFDPAVATGVLDWGRGVWTYANTWYWGSASGYINSAPFGMNLGYGFGDTSAATENMLFYKGVAHKLDQVDFGIPRDARGRDDLMSPWHVTDNQGRVDLTFTPAMDRAALTSALIIQSDQHQVFGHFSGHVTLDDGTVLKISHLLGFAEKVSNRW